MKISYQMLNVVKDQYLAQNSSIDLDSSSNSSGSSNEMEQLDVSLCMVNQFLKQVGLEDDF